MPTPSAYYSPGICPTYYSIACSSVVAIGSVSETRATCCPSAYSCQTFSDGWPGYSTELCTYAGTATSTFLLTKATTVSTSVGTPDFNAYGIQIRWQQSDTAVPSTTSASSTTTSTPALTSASPLATSTSPSSSNKISGLSTGAKAGIGIGAAIGGLLVLAGIIFLILRRRRAAVNEQGATNTSQTQHYYAEVEAEDIQRKARQPFHELPEHSRKHISPAELSTES